MKTLKNTKYLIILFCTAAALTLLLLLPRVLPDIFAFDLAFPFVQIKMLLSSLAETGKIGNGISFVLLAGCILAPIILLLVSDGIRRDRALRIAGVVLSVVLGIGYLALWKMEWFFRQYSSEPDQDFNGVNNAAVGAVMWSGVVCFLTVLMIIRIRKSNSQKLIGYGAAVLSIIGGVILASACGSVISTLIDIVNQDQNDLTFVNMGCVVFEVIPAAASILAVLAAVNTLTAYGENDMDKVLMWSDITGRRCITALILNVSISLICNLVSLLLSRYMNNTNVTVNIPLFEIAITLVVLLAVKLIERNKQLSDDNDMFI